MPGLESQQCRLAILLDLGGSVQEYRAAANTPYNGSMPGVHDDKAQSRRLVPVDAGPLSAMIVLRTSLSGLGLPSVVESEHIKTWNPFATGGFMFGTRLLVPASQATEVRQAIAELRQSAKQPVERTESNGDQEEIAETLGLRIRWSAVLDATAPIGLYHALSYMALVHRLPHRPRGHGMVIGAIVLCLIQIVVLAIVLIVLVAMIAR